jgi:hypothetical protein
VTLREGEFLGWTFFGLLWFDVKRERVRVMLPGRLDRVPITVGVTTRLEPRAHSFEWTPVPDARARHP